MAAILQVTGDILMSVYFCLHDSIQWESSINQGIRLLIYQDEINVLCGYLIVDIYLVAWTVLASITL